MQHSTATALAMPPTATGGIARCAVAHAIGAGLDPAPLLQKAGLTSDQIADEQTRLGVENQIVLLNLLAEALHDDLLGFHLARNFELREGGLFYFVLESSSIVGEALARAERYSVLTDESVVLQCRNNDDGLVVRYAYSGVPRYEDRHQIEFWITALVRMCRELTETRLSPLRITLVHPRCGISSEFETYLGCAIAFAAERDEVFFADGTGRLPLTGADPYLNRLLIRYCEEALSRRGHPASPIKAAVENAIVPLLPHGTARASEVARALGMSRRTLARRLASEGLTYSGILDELRAHLAERHLDDESLSISRIAWLLGFQEVSAFSHAVRRWKGQTPKEVRATRS